MVEGPGAELVREDDLPAVAVYVSRCGRRPLSAQAGEIVAVVGEDPRRLRAWAAVSEKWAATHEPGSGVQPYVLSNVRRMLENLAEDLQARQGSNLGALPEAQRAAKRRAERRAERDPTAEEREAKARRNAELDAAIEALPDEEREELRRQAAERVQPGLSAAIDNPVHPSRNLVTDTVLRPVMRELVTDSANPQPLTDHV